LEGGVFGEVFLGRKTGMSGNDLLGQNHEKRERKLQRGKRRGEGRGRKKKGRGGGNIGGGWGDGGETAGRVKGVGTHNAVESL